MHRPTKTVRSLVSLTLSAVMIAPLSALGQAPAGNNAQPDLFEALGEPPAKAREPRVALRQRTPLKNLSAKTNARRQAVAEIETTAKDLRNDLSLSDIGIALGGPLSNAAAANATAANATAANDPASNGPATNINKTAVQGSLPQTPTMATPAEPTLAPTAQVSDKPAALAGAQAVATDAPPQSAPVGVRRGASDAGLDFISSTASSRDTGASAEQKPVHRVASNNLYCVEASTSAAQTPATDTNQANATQVDIVQADIAPKFSSGGEAYQREPVSPSDSFSSNESTASQWNADVTALGTDRKSVV